MVNILVILSKKLKTQYMNSYYVYILIDPRNDLPFYVGKGTRNRMYQHVVIVKRNKITNRNKHLTYKIQKILHSGFDDVKYIKVFEHLDESIVFEKEKELIKEIGINNLCNIYLGGEGATHTDETKRKIGSSMKGKIPWNKGKTGICSEETLQQMSTAHKGKIIHQRIREKMSTSHIGLLPTQETRDKIRKANIGNQNLLGYKHTEETKRKIREGLKKRRKN